MLPPKLLLIDDDAILRDLLALHLELQGYQILTASDGQAGLVILNETNVDLIVLDLMMPVMDGLRFMRALNAALPAPPSVIVLSAAGHGDREKELKAAGAHFVIRKPVDPQEFLACVRRALPPRN